jgi:hypothetical protein
MTVRTSLPGPRTNRTRSGFIGLADDLAGTDLVVAAGDFTGGTPEDEFNWLLYKSAAGVVTGRAGTRFRVKKVDADSFQITDTAGTVIENTADGTAVFLKGTGEVSDAYVQTVILPNLIVANGDFTGGAAEDVFYPTIETGFGALEDADPIKLLYKSAAGVLTGIAAGTTVYVKTIVAQATTVPGKFETAATAGGADIENTADGLAVFIKTA